MAGERYHDGHAPHIPGKLAHYPLVDTLGSVIAIAGTGEENGNLGDGGPGTVALVGLAEDVAVAPDGRVYFSDLVVGRIRVLTREPF